MRDLDKDSEVGRERARVTETEIGGEREEGSWEIRGPNEMMNEDGERGERDRKKCRGRSFKTVCLCV